MRYLPATDLILCAMLAGCATPQPVLDLAEKTSANVAVISTRLRQISDESERLYAMRADNIARLRATNATARANLAYDTALTRKVGEQADVEMVADLQTWVKEVDDIFAAAADVEKQSREALLGRRLAIDTKSQALQKVAETLAALANKETFDERVRLLANFAAEVRDDLKKNLDDGSASSAQAKALLDQIRSSLTHP